MDSVLELFKELAVIPSPSLEEKNVSKRIQEITYENGINAYYDNYENLIIDVPANANDKKPILLSSHMDVVGNSSPVNIQDDGKYLKTDGTRTLGADDKAGVACALQLAIYLTKHPEIKHGGLEIIFTRDEESNMTGIYHVEFDKIKSENVLVLDSDKLGDFLTSGAGYTRLDVSVTTKLGGHSGNDIHEKNRYNAAKLIADLVSKLPNGVYKREHNCTITSCNLGSIVAGATDIGVERLLQNKEIKDDFSKNLVKISPDNMINTNAYAHYSLRSSVKKYEDELIKKFQKQIDKFNHKYGDLAHAELVVQIHMLPFEKSLNQEMPEIANIVGKKLNIKVETGSFHAGAETHVYANKVNKDNKKFKPILVGIANIDSMHSPSERVEKESLVKGYEFVKEIFLEYNK